VEPAQPLTVQAVAWLQVRGVEPSTQVTVEDAAPLLTDCCRRKNFCAIGTVLITHETVMGAVADAPAAPAIK